MSKVIRIDIYSNAIVISNYISQRLDKEHIIRLRWWQRSKAIKMIDEYYSEMRNGIEKNNIEWWVQNIPYMRYDFRTRQSSY